MDITESINKPARSRQQYEAEAPEWQCRRDCEGHGPSVIQTHSKQTTTKLTTINILYYYKLKPDL